MTFSKYFEIYYIEFPLKDLVTRQVFYKASGYPYSTMTHLYLLF